MSSGPREWNAGSYDQVAAPMTRRGRELLRRLELGTETVLDAGCGMTRSDRGAAGHAPAGRVIALDGSAAMLEKARERFGDDERVTLLQHDLREPLPFHAELDAIVSTSTLHWVPDHPAVFKRFAAALRPAKTLVWRSSAAPGTSRACSR